MALHNITISSLENEKNLEGTVYPVLSKKQKINPYSFLNKQSGGIKFQSLDGDVKSIGLK